MLSHRKYSKTIQNCVVAKFQSHRMEKILRQFQIKSLSNFSLPAYLFRTLAIGVLGVSTNASFGISVCRRVPVLMHEWILNCTTPTRLLGKRIDVTHRSNLTSSASVGFRIHSKFHDTDQICRNRPFLFSLEIIPFHSFPIPFCKFFLSLHLGET